MAYPQTLRSTPVIGFIACTTVLSVLIGSFAKAQWIAIELDIAPYLPPPSPYWHICVAIMGLLIPIVLRVLYRRHPLICRFFNAYLMVFIAQIVSELVLTPLFMRGISVIIGSFYSGFRLLQLWQGQSWMTKIDPLPRWLRVYVWSLMVIWAINLLRFILYRWPILLR